MVVSIASRRRIRIITEIVITRGTVRPVMSPLFIVVVGLSVFVIELLLIVEISLAVNGIVLCKLKFCS